MPRVARFGKFEFDLDRELLRRSGLSVRLPPQPSKLLALLLVRAGEVVTREEIQHHLWPDGTHVDYEQGINHSIRQIRSVLGDDAATARFVLTVPKVGYRFFGVVECADGNGHVLGEPVETSRERRPDEAPQQAEASPSTKVGVLSTRLVLWLAVLVVLLGALVALRGNGIPEAADPAITLKRLTSHGRVGTAAISPDGRHMVDARFEDGVSVYMSSLETGSEMRIFGPVDTRILAVGFYPDGERIYFVRQHTQGPGYSSLYQVPALGGPALELVFDIDTGVGFSPDGSRMAYIRWFPFQGESALITANPDGTDERTISVWKAAGSFGIATPSWSPDGERIAVAGRLARADAGFVPVVVDVETGERETIGDRRWDVLTGMAWTRSGSSIVMIAEPPGVEDRSQIWSLSYPAGRASQLTNDLDSYRTISMSADGSALLTILRENEANLYSLDIGEEVSITPWTTGTLPRDLVFSVRSLADGSVAYVTREEDRFRFWKIESPRGPRRHLLPDSFTGAATFEISADAESIFYITHDQREIPQLFMLPASGGIPVQITSGDGVRFGGACSSNGPYLIKRLNEEGLWRIDAPGGPPVKISDWTPWGSSPYCSPDREKVMFVTFVEEAGRFDRFIVVLPIEGGEPIHRFPWPDGFQPLWTPDGDAVAYVHHGAAGSDIFSLALASGETRRLTNMADEFIFSWDWRNGGASIIASRGRNHADVVLITTHQELP